MEALAGFVAAAGERADGFGVAGVEVHVLAPAAGLQDEPARPAGRDGVEAGVELQVHLLAGAEDRQRAVGLGDEFAGIAEGRVVAALVAGVPVRGPVVVVVVGLPLVAGRALGEAGAPQVTKPCGTPILMAYLLTNSSPP